MRRRICWTGLALACAAAWFGAACLPGYPLAGGAQAAAPAYIWWEAEAPQATNFPNPDKHPFTPANEAEAGVLSGGRWIGTAGKRSETLFLEYEVTAPAKGRYLFYARKFWKHGPFRWRFDDQPWRQVGKDIALLDEASLRPLLGANWVSLGALDLGAGAHKLRIELTENDGAAAFDAFLLTRAPFLARGKLKPGEKYDRAPEGWFAFEPDADPFKQSPIDLRPLNEAHAGANGFIRVKGGEFVHGKTGAPVRFWAVNAGPDIARLDRASVDYLARFLAKKGVNMVRYHGTIYQGSGPDVGRIDTEMLDKVHYFVAALRREGIYTTLSIYFPLWVRLSEAAVWPGYQGDQKPFALLFFNEDFQKMYRGWWKTLLTSPNPYTGKPLNQDPAVAFLEMVNEDSYLFWTFTPYKNIPAPQMAILEKQFGGWLQKKYGSLGKAFAAWGGKPVRGDDAAAGRAGFLDLSQIFGQKSPRAQDTATFLTEHQRAFFRQTYDYLKKDLGFQGSVYGSNWITANAQILGPLDKYANTAADFLDRHGYFDPPHEGPRAAYALSPGDRYDDRSALRFQPKKSGDAPSYGLPIMDLQYNGMPSTITEINWPMPNRYRADQPLLAAAYGALQGSDGLFFFALASPSWQDSHGKFDLQTPVTLGQFPATALLYRKGLVTPAPPVVDVRLKLGDLFALRGSPVAAPANLDELRAKDIPPGQTIAVDSVTSIDPLAFLVGKVSMSISPEGGKSRIADLSRYIDRDAKTVRSQTGELVWNWDKGSAVLLAPRAQGVTGFLAGAGAVPLKDVTVNAGMEYGTVLLVALDDKPLAESGKILLQVMSEDKNYGWEAPGSGLRPINNLGGAPIVVKNMAGTVSLNRGDADRLKVTALDFNGYGRKAVGSAKSIALLPDTLYYLIEK